MSPELGVPAALLTGALVSFAVTPMAIRVARRTSFYDVPAGYKGHRRPTPYLGGAAIMAGIAAAALLTGAATSRYGLLLILAAGMWVLGTVDDRVGLPLAPRAAIEIGVGALLWATGHGWTPFHSDVLNAGLTIFWLFGVMNAFNLMDNMDGIASSCASISAVGAGALALVAGQTPLALLCFAVAGACAGFLPHNLAGPARIFMGDGGSLPVGFLVASLAMAAAAANSPGLSALIVAALLVAAVILDTSLVVFSRRRGGRPVLVGGRDHLSHRLRGRLESPRRVAATLAGAQLAVAGIAVLVAAIDVLWILMFGSVVATLGVVAIVVLEGPLFFERRAAAAYVGEPAPGAARSS